MIMSEKSLTQTNQVVREAMKLVNKDVRAPQVVRLGAVRPTKQSIPTKRSK